MSKQTQCMCCMGGTAWDECGGFDADDHPVCESCMDDHCKDYDCEEDPCTGETCKEEGWKRVE